MPILSLFYDSKNEDMCTPVHPEKKVPACENLSFSPKLPAGSIGRDNPVLDLPYPSQASRLPNTPRATLRASEIQIHTKCPARGYMGNRSLDGSISIVLWLRETTV